MINKKISITAVFIAYNEEMIIGRSINAVKDWVDEIILIDMHSTDKTREIASDCGATIKLFDKVNNFGIARNYGIKMAKNDWILSLDADEIVSPGLKEQIIAGVKEDSADLFLLPRANFAFSGFGPNESGFPEYLPRCFKRDSMEIDKYKGELHLCFEPKQNIRIKKLIGSFPKVSLYHITNATIECFINKINTYTSIEAVERYDIGFKISLIYVLLRPIKIFLRHYFKKCGFRDGWRGLWLTLFNVFYEYLVLSKIWEMNLHNGKKPTIQESRIMMYKLFEK